MDEFGRRRFLTTAATAATAGAFGIKTLTGTAAAATRAAHDRRSVAGYVDVQLLNITDLHGYLAAPPAGDSVITGTGGRKYAVGGVAYMATHLARLRAGRANSFFFAPGDLFSGWDFPAATLADEPTIEALNRLGLDFATAGNHEFDRTPGFLRQHMEQGLPYEGAGQTNAFPDSGGARFHGADFRYYSANTVSGAGGATLLPPYNIEYVDAPGGKRLPIGFIHLTVLGTESGSTSYQPGLTTLDQLSAANLCAARLKALGVGAIVLSMHDGAVAGSEFDSGTAPSGPAYELALRVSSDIDAIVTGHWHSAFNMMLPGPDGRLRPFVEAGCHGQIINEITLRLDRDTGKVHRALTTSVNHPNTRDVAPDPALQEVVDYWAGYAKQHGAKVIGRQRASFRRELSPTGESTMGNLVADWALWAAAQPPESSDTSPRPDRAGADLALIALAPRIGRSVINTDLLAGPALDDPIAFERAWRAVGYGCPLVSAEVSGQQLHDALEQQWSKNFGLVTYAPLAVSANVRYSFDPAGPVGGRVAPGDVFIDGAALRPEATYRVVTTSYTWIGQDGYPALGGFRAPARHRRDLDSFPAYVAAMGVLKAVSTGRVMTKDSPYLAPDREVLMLTPSDPVPGLPAPVAAAVQAARDAGRRPDC
ncbi:bifunctional metallophosphatase/5'-nucleotidase [Streptomyces sp. NBC_00503]|uniref:bifunctional metallophosphatase/5'-nucleotidase n=1 Tax=Streptomyces sp. NBC_00503 TaxID=2903659 RepID=UPI002E820F06|nr:bifunctional metallophosphatase/5'-nucleotidase [Streptomyces sp. NBC_00503]WUD79419.1 bifunctional metallophosphatase/5'-nucleotidase [Streptomyces sp. NBC_00503]